MTKRDVQDEKICQLKDKQYEVECRTKWLEEHWSTFNSEMGQVQTDVAWLKKEFTDLCKKFDDLTSKLTIGFVFTIASTIVIQVIIALFK